MSNSFGKCVVVTTFGESHGSGLGVVMDGLPAGLAISAEDIQGDLDKRRPGRSEFTSARNEPDKVEIVSGLSTAGITNGAPLTCLIRNHDQKSRDYRDDVFRPGHADWPYYVKYGLTPQPGGGRASGRETVARVAAGAVARKLLGAMGISVNAYAVAVAGLKAAVIDESFAASHALRFADPGLAPQAENLVRQASAKGDSTGGVLEVKALNVPAGWGEPVFDKLEALLGAAYFSIGAVRGVEFGKGMALSAMPGSQANDPLGPDGPLSNNHGGILAGISTGQPIVARLYVKPTPSVHCPQNTVDINGENVVLSTGGRHDPCLLPRMAPVAEAMTLLVLLDAYMRHRASAWRPNL